jgi:hypothetical protein
MPGITWNTSEIARLVVLLRDGHPIAAVGIGNRSTAAVRNKAARLSLIGDGISRKRWSHKDEERLKSLVKKGWSVKKIAESSQYLAGFSRNAIAKKAGRLGLADKSRSIRAQQAVRFTESQKREFHRFLRDKTEHCTPELLAILWNKKYSPEVSRRRVIYHQTRLNIKRPWAEVIQMRFSKNKRDRHRAKLARLLKARWARHRTLVKSQFEEEARALRKRANKNGKQLRERQCTSCRKRWPEKTPFFHLHSKKTTSQSRRYLSRSCRLCINKRRRKKLGQLQNKTRKSTSVSEP